MPFIIFLVVAFSWYSFKTLYPLDSNALAVFFASVNTPGLLLSPSAMMRT
jgi:hypothetical protein